MKRYKPTDWVKPLHRLGDFPIDITSLFDNLEEVMSYIQTNGTAYAGQIISVINETDKTVDVYKVVYDINPSEENINGFALELIGANTTGNVIIKEYFQDLLSSDAWLNKKGEDTRYEGMMVYAKDMKNVFILIDAENPNNELSWKPLIGGSSTGSANNAIVSKETLAELTMSISWLDEESGKDTREEGLVVYVKETGKIYTLVDATNPNNISSWEEIVYKSDIDGIKNGNIVVDTFDDLVNEETWENAGGGMPYEGLIVYVKDEQTLYVLVDAENPNDTDSWQMVKSDGGIANIESLDDDIIVNVSGDTTYIQMVGFHGGII